MTSLDNSAARSDRVGTAADPIDGSLNLGATPSTHNLRAKWAEEISSIIKRINERQGKTLAVWAQLGRKLNTIADKFVKYDDNGKPALSAKGDIIKDNNAYNAWLVSNGFTTGILSNPNTRTAAKKLAECWDDVQRIPACTRHGHPVHAMTAFTTFKNALDVAKSKFKGENFNPLDFAASYVEAPRAASGGSVPHTVDTCLFKLRSAMNGGASLIDLARTVKGNNEQKAMIQLLCEALSKSESEVARLTLDLEEAGFQAAAPEAKPEGKKPRKAPKPKAKTESGDERVPGETEFFDGKDGETIDGDYSEVAPSILSLPAPKSDDESI